MTTFDSIDQIGPIIPKNSVTCGDCLAVMPKIPDKSVQLILADLPYGTIKGGCDWDTIIPFEPLWEQYERIIADNGAIVLTASQPFTSLLVASNPKLFKYELIWCKEQGNQPQLCNIQPMKAHENILVFGKGRLTYNPQFTTGKPYNKKQPKEICKAEHLGRTNFSGVAKTNSTKRYPISYLRFNCERTGHHPTQKPVPLFEYLIKTYTNKGDTVLDNTAGSGTTALAAINTHRKYILIEQEMKYINTIVSRINNTSPPLGIL